MSLSSDIDDETSLLGKYVTDLQEDVEIAGGVITGALHYVTEFTGFSGDPAEQEGNYLAVVCEASEGDTITAELIGGQHGPVTLDPDGILIARITDPATQKLRFTATGTDGTTETKEYSLSGLSLEEEDDT